MEIHGNSKEPKKWISDRTIAERYEIARSTVWAWTREGRIPKPVKLSENITRWDEEAVEKHFNERTDSKK